MTPTYISLPSGYHGRYVNDPCPTQCPSLCVVCLYKLTEELEDGAK
jgi:hypothetical protein